MFLLHSVCVFSVKLTTQFIGEHSAWFSTHQFDFTLNSIVGRKSDLSSVNVNPEFPGKIGGHSVLENQNEIL